MPFISVDHFVGPDPALRRELQEKLAAVVTQHFEAPPGNVRVFTRAFDPADVYVTGGNHDSGLPIIRAEFLPGRNLDQKRALVRDLARTTAEVLHVPLAQIRTVLYEREREEWARGDVMMADMK
jgi:phenylpyruvate tautomerase PptA (4-oxalocrotonate tautomerase family)